MYFMDDPHLSSTHPVAPAFWDRAVQPLQSIQIIFGIVIVVICQLQAILQIVKFVLTQINFQRYFLWTQTEVWNCNIATL